MPSKRLLLISGASAALVLATAAGAAEDENKPKSKFLDAVTAIVDWIPNIDRSIEGQITTEKRNLLIKKLNRLANSLNDLEVKK